MEEEFVKELYEIYDKLYRHKEGENIMTAIQYYEKLLPVKIYETLCEISDILLNDTSRTDMFDIEISNRGSYSFDFKDGHLLLCHDSSEVVLKDAEVNLLMEALTLMLINENGGDIESWLKASLATSYTLAFNETRRICETKEHKHYSATLGLLVEDSQTAYNLHKSRNESNS